MKQDLIPWGQSSIHTDENDQRTLILRSLQSIQQQSGTFFPVKKKNYITEVNHLFGCV